MSNDDFDKREPRVIALDGPFAPAEDEDPTISTRHIVQTGAYELESTEINYRETSGGDAAVNAEPDETGPVHDFVETLRSAGLSNEVILSVLRGSERGCEMARAALLAFDGDRRVNRQLVGVLDRLHSYPPVQRYIREHLNELLSHPPYGERILNQERRRYLQYDAQQRQLREAMAMGTTPSNQLLLERMRASTDPPEIGQLLNQAALDDMRRWGRDEIDPQTRQEVMRNFAEQQDEVQPQIITPIDVQRHIINQQVEADSRLLYDWVWDRLVSRLADSGMGVQWIGSEAFDLFHPFGVTPRLTFNQEAPTRSSLRIALSIDGPHARDLHGRLIVGNLTYHPAILMVLNTDGRYDFANFGHRRTPGAGSEDHGDAAVRGRGSSSGGDEDAGRPEGRIRGRDIDL